MLWEISENTKTTRYLEAKRPARPLMPTFGETRGDIAWIFPLDDLLSVNRKNERWITIVCFQAIHFAHGNNRIFLFFSQINYG